MHTPTASVPRASAEQATLTLQRGACLGSYELVLPIGLGGMGRVWIAARRGDFGFQRMFAVKVMREELAESASFRRMFFDEARLVARLRHTNVVEVLDLGEDSGTVYQAMALVDGDSLSGLLALAEAASGARWVSPEIAGRVICDVLRGLHAAHGLTDDNGMPLELVHRDVSPQNILVGLDGVSKIADFGVAKAVGTGGGSSGPVGKRAYMAPEQLLGDPLDCRCDVFAAGVVLWQLLAGKRSSGFGAALLSGRAIEPPRAVRPDANERLSEVAMRALSSRAEDRYATADAMADAIEQAAFESGLALSTKRVGAWVAELVGARVSEQREEARREFELSHVSVVTHDDDATAKEPSPEAETIDESPADAAANVAPQPVASSRGRVVAGAGIAIVATAAVVIGGVWAMARKGTASQAEPGASIAGAAEAPAAAPASAAPAVSAMADPPSTTSVTPPSASSPSSPSSSSSPPAGMASASSDAHPRVPSRPRAGARAPTKASSTPNLPYDNPYKR